jgi:small subunit ribosomal protein S21
MIANERGRSDNERSERPERSERSERSSDGRRQSRRGHALTVVVDDRGIEAALRVFKRLILKEGLLKDIKRHAHFEKPGDRKRRKRREAIRRRRRQAARTRDRLGGDRE